MAFSGDCVSARTVLWYVTFFGFGLNYLVRINLNMAIVAMVAPRVTKVGQVESECFVHLIPLNSSAMDNSSSLSKPEGFDWNESEQGMVLGAFFWLHWVTQVPGGILAQRYGGKAVFGLMQLIGILACLATPAAAYLNIYVLIALRLIQGIAMGLCWPAMHHMSGKWIPPNERSKFVTAYLGSSVGTGVMYPVCGLLIGWFGWESVFYVSGALGLIWFIAWWTLVFDSPSEHPRISDHERNYILKSLGQTAKKEKLKTPWRAMLLSKPLWMNSIAQWGGLWGLFTILTQSPTYFKIIHGWDIKAVGVLSGLPHIVRMICAYFFSLIGDYLLRTDKVSRTNVRKLATVVCVIVQGLITLLLAFVGCDADTAIILVVAAMGANGAVSTGPLASVIDLAPNFSGVSLGIVGTISAIPGFISPAIVGALTLNNQTSGQWQMVWLISAGMQLICGIIYVIFAESEVQPWNSPSTKPLEESGVLLRQVDTLKNDDALLTT